MLVEEQRDGVWRGYSSTYVRYYLRGDAGRGRMVDAVGEGLYRDGVRGTDRMTLGHEGGGAHGAGYDADCIFCRIAAGELPADVVASDERFVAFTDLHPVAPVHVLIVPRAHVASLDDDR